MSFQSETTKHKSSFMLPQKFPHVSLLPKNIHFYIPPLFTRAGEHVGISNLTGKRLKCVKQSVVSDHPLECNSSIDFDHFDILAS